MLIKAFVESVRINLQNNSRVVIIKDSKIERYLLIWIGEMEALAIASALQGQKFDRPLTHDLFVQSLHALGAHLTTVTITGVRENTFFAEMLLDHAGHHVTIDARPSDALALAVRVDAEILVSEDVFENSGISVAHTTEEEDSKLAIFRDFVNRLDV